MFASMSHIDHENNNRLRQYVLVALAIVGLSLLVATLLSAGARQAQAEPLSTSDSSALQEVTDYLQGVKNMQGDFLQIGPDGSIAEGKFYLRRPGRLRFEYNPPSDLLVVADGIWVGIKEGSGPPQRYPLGSTPLNLLLDETVDLTRDTRIISVDRQPGVLRVTLADKTNKAPGEITLVFDEPRLQLRQWVVTDAQGLQTTVALRNIQTGINAANELFVMRDEQRPFGGKNN
ncbi:MAG: outer membrane lipoprotein carrier protein LolA [Rhizobiales bacterium]|nr:outer membrane lipoprotein carrier protein LolA [Hyphomicrobiales bacterium]